MTFNCEHTQTGSTRIERYIARAHCLHARAIGDSLIATYRWLATSLRQCQRRIAERVARRAAFRALSRLDHHQLRDMGLSRADLDAIADGSFDRDKTRRQRD